jgi:hypothetical protein
MTESSELTTDLTTVVFAALCGISANEQPLDSGLHARFTHRVIAYAVRAALQEGNHFEETLLASVLWSYPDFRFSYDDVRYVLRRLLQRGQVTFVDGEYSLATGTEEKQ